MLLGFSPDDLQSQERVPVMLEFQAVPMAVYRCECEAPTDAAMATYEQGLRREHDEFMTTLRKLGVSVEWAETKILVATPDGGVKEEKIRHQFTYLFNGMGLMIPGHAIEMVAAIGPVRAVHANPERPYLVKDSGLSPDTPQAAPAEHNTSIPFLGVDKLWNRPQDQGGPVTGDGVVVAVIDTGVDYTHPAFGGQASVPNEKTVYAVSLTGEPPLDNFGHGSHVAGIIAGDLFKGTARGDSNMQGVAPKAKIMSYKVLTGRGSGTSSSIIMAMEDAVKRGAHVLNLSLGDSQNDPHSPEAIAAGNAMKAGAVVCVAAGNSGPARGTVGSPGTSLEVVTAGASTDPSTTAQFAQVLVDGKPTQPVATHPLQGSADVTTLSGALSYVKCGLGQKDADFPAAVKGNVALIQRGAITFGDKAKHAAAAGALAAIIYNNQPGTFLGSVSEVGIPVISISQEDGYRLLGLGFDDSGLSKAQLQMDGKPQPQPDRLAEFSSRGPTMGAGLKPEVCAPGVGVYSTTIVPKMALDPNGSMADASGYTKASGTSMATPHIAGVAALLRHAHPKWDSATIKAAMVNTAKFMDNQGGVLDQGAGRVQPELAVQARSVLVAKSNGQPQYSFGMYKNGGKLSPATFLLQDVASQAQEYTVRAYFTQGHESLSVELSSTQLAVPAAGAAEVQFSLTVHASLPAGDYGGYLEAVDKAGAVLRAPFYLQVEQGRPGDVQPSVMLFPGQLPHM